MTNYLDRNIEALLARRELAEKATPGPWFAICSDDEMCMNTSYVATKDEDAPPEEAYRHIVALTLYQAKRVACHQDERWNENAAHIAANAPSTVMADIDEILRLRAEVERLENEANWLALVLANVGCGVPESEYIDMDINGMSPPEPEHWREAARNAVKEDNNANS